MSGQWLGVAITKQAFEKVIVFVEAKLNCLQPRGGNSEITPATHDHPIMLLVQKEQAHVSVKLSSNRVLRPRVLHLDLSFDVGKMSRCQRRRLYLFEGQPTDNYLILSRQRFNPWGSL